MNPHLKKSQDVTSGDLAGHLMFVLPSEPLSIQLFGSFWFSHCLTVLDQRVGLHPTSIWYFLFKLFSSQISVKIFSEWSHWFQTLYTMKDNLFFLQYGRHLKKYLIYFLRDLYLCIMIIAHFIKTDHKPFINIYRLIY